jgi:hypothetical protein
LSRKNITAVAACYSHSLAVDSNGTLYSWGSQSYTNVPAAGPPGGSNSNEGWLGTNNANDYYVPTYVWTAGRYGVAGLADVDPMPNKFIAVSCGQYFSMDMTSDGLLYGWGMRESLFVLIRYIGSNKLQQLGDSTTTNCPLGKPVILNLIGKKAVAVACGQSHSVALTSDGLIIS